MTGGDDVTFAVVQACQAAVVITWIALRHRGTQRQAERTAAKAAAAKERTS